MTTPEPFLDPEGIIVLAVILAVVICLAWLMSRKEGE